MMVALCSKTYVLRDGEGVEKMALKDMKKKFVSQSLDKCKHMLISFLYQLLSSINKSFRVHDNTILTY